MSCPPDPCQPIDVEPCKFLVDYLMRIGSTNVYFVAKLPAIIKPWGPVFDAKDMHQAELRAASTLAQTGLIRGQSLQFLRLAVPWTEAELASFLGVTVPDIQGWEAETVGLPRTIWLATAHYLAALDGRENYDIPPPCPMDNWQPRVIRVYPDFPMQVQPQYSSTGCIPC